MIDISSRRGKALGCEAGRTTRGPNAEVYASGGVPFMTLSRSLDQQKLVFLRQSGI